MSSEINIIALPRAPRAVRRFLNVSYGIYREDPNWVAPLLADLQKVFTDANPLFEHAEMQLWVATRGGRDVGRIAGILDSNHNHAAKDNAAFYGYYECVDDGDASHALFEAVLAWARQKGVRRVLGPMNPTTNDESGLLVEGLGERPVLMMTYNPPYYIRLVEAEGFVKAKDLLAFHVDIAKAPLERLDRLAVKTRQRYPELAFRAVSRRTLTADLAKIKEVYNAAWEDNWGFVPMTDAEIDFMAGRLKALLVEGLVWLVESPKEPVGFMLAIPDYNEVFQPLRGRLLTPRLLGALPYLLQWKYPKRCRVVTLGTKVSWRGRGLEAVMLSEGFKTGRRVGFHDAEASWILEDNTMMCRFMEMFGARVYRRYRIYERAL
jgi:GNAT superfamily N-acetyltransferase